MVSGFHFISRTVILACVALLGVSAFGQDLGSSNKLFGGGKTNSSSGKKEVKKATAKPKASPAKATAAKTKTVKAKPKTTAKKSTLLPKPAANAKVNTKTPANTETAKKPGNVVTTKIDPATTEIPRPKIAEMPDTAGSEELFENLIEQGNKARDERNYSAAEAAYKRARSVRSRDSRAAYGLGNLYSDQQRWGEAESHYRAALQIESGSAFAHIALSYVLTQPLLVSDLSERYAEAERLARRAIQFAPSNALAFDQLGVAMELRGLIGAETENAYRRAITLDPSFAPAYAHLGRLLRRRGLTKESSDAYQKALERSTDVATIVLVAEVMQSEQRFAESEKLLRKAVASDPRNQSALLILSRALTALGNFTDAETTLRKSLEIDPNGFVANSLMGTLFIRQGKVEMAENSLLQALRFVSDLEKRQLSQQFEAVGDGYTKAGKSAAAERSYRQAIALDIENVSLAGKLAAMKSR